MRWAIFVLPAIMAVQANAQSNSFGFNYWPAGYLSDSLFSANWSTQKNVVLQDILQMKALGAGVVRLTFWPNAASGWWLSKNGTGSAFNSNYHELVQNLPALLKMFSDHRIKVIIAFYNGPMVDWRTNGLPDWMAAYGRSQAGWINFLHDSQKWMNGIVNAAESSSSRAAVLYYDMANEWWMSVDNTYGPGLQYEQWYLNFIYDHVAIPAGKHGVSTLATREFVSHIKVALGSRILDYYDIHSYPVDAPDSGNVEQLYDLVRGIFPNSTIVMGEFGRRNIQGGEVAQAATVLDIRARALRTGYRYTLNWAFWDDPISVQGGFGYGFGVNPNAARDLLGIYANSLGFLTNPDFEWGGCQGQPYGWNYAADTGVQASLQHNTVGVDSGLCNARMITHATNIGTQAWMCSSTRAGALTGRQKFYANFFTRTSMRDVRVAVFQYRANGSYITSTTSPGYNEAVWSWRNFGSATSPWYVQLSPEADFGTVCIIGRTQNNTDYLDVDAVSAWAE